MAFHSVHLATLAILLFSSLHAASSLSCYTCASVILKSCDDPFDSAQIPTAPCSEPHEVCIKQVLPDVGTLRGCGAKSLCALANNSKSCSTCDINMCNLGLRDVPSHLLLLLPIFCYFIKVALR